MISFEMMNVFLKLCFHLQKSPFAGIRRRRANLICEIQNKWKNTQTVLNVINQAWFYQGALDVKGEICTDHEWKEEYHNILESQTIPCGLP